MAPIPSLKNHWTRNMTLLAFVIVPMVVALLQAAGFWQFLHDAVIANTPIACDFEVDEIKLSQATVETGETLTLSIRAYSPEGKPLVYIWAATYGTVEPKGQTTSQVITYTAPRSVNNDTVTVSVIAAGCKSIDRHAPITIIQSPSPTPVPSPTPTTFVPGTNILSDDAAESGVSNIFFDYDPGYGDGSLRLRFCVERKYYRLRSFEYSPSRRLLFDMVEEVSQPCIIKYPVTRFRVNDIENVCLSSADTPEATTVSMRCYTIKRTALTFERVPESPSSQAMETATPTVIVNVTQTP